MPTWKELKRFCEGDGWELTKKKADHWYYQKVMPDGTIKWTKVSHGTGEIPKGLFREILKKQLQVTLEEFNEKI